MTAMVVMVVMVAAMIVMMMVISMMMMKARTKIRTANIGRVKVPGFRSSLTCFRTRTQTPRRWTSIPPVRQVFLISGLMVLVFEIFAVPNLTPRIGIRMSQRVGSVCELPVYFLIPLLSRADGADFPVTIALLILLFMCYVCSNSVSYTHLTLPTIYSV